MTIFSPEALAKVVAETLPPDAMVGSKAVVGTVDQSGVQVLASFKLKRTANGPAWELQAAARHDWDNTNSVGAKVLLQW